MSKIRISSGKGKGLGDQHSLDPLLGCPNGCKGCYATKTSRTGGRFMRIKEKELDEKILRQDLRKVREEYVRIGKHCDPGYYKHLDRLLYICYENKIKGVVVTRSLKFGKVVENFKKGNHILHFSIGMKRDEAFPLSLVSLFNAIQFKRHINVFIRVNAIIDEPIDLSPDSKYIIQALKNFPVIITPMRFMSTKIAKEYNVDLGNYRFQHGFWRSTKIHNDWKGKMICGEIEKDYCCNCGITCSRSD